MKPLVLTVDDARDPETNAPLGGITGHTSLGVLFIDLFFLPEELRRGGVGSRLLQLAEDEGRRRGCVTSFLYTISFQAPGFYERHGYRVLGTIPCNPPGTRRLFLTKALG
jgi:GNAT superfamily N-acetyltransferase